MSAPNKIQQAARALEVYDYETSPAGRDRALATVRDNLRSLISDAVYPLSSKLVEVVWATLTYYSNRSTYDAPRIGGTLAGSPRGDMPTREALTEWAIYALRAIRKEIPDPRITVLGELPKFLVAHEQRKRFETYMHTLQPNPLLMERNVPSGLYKGYEIQLAWATWKACAEVDVPDSYFHPT